ncbi:MAG: dihydrofolate reductase family protein [Halioglobus sp.]
MKCSVYIATSADGYIATVDGGVDWLDSAGNAETEEREPMGDGGFSSYLDSVDCMVMGRRTMEKIASFNLTPDQWPYREIPIHVLSKSVSKAPRSLPGNVRMYSGTIPELYGELERSGFGHVYVDGGATITSFFQHDLIDELCVSQAPILLGGGLPLFGKIGKVVRLSEAKAQVFSNDFIQWKYTVDKV